MKEILTLPKEIEQVIYEYTHLKLGNKDVVCPYHINARKERVGLRVLVGKGDTGEITKEVEVVAKSKNVDLSKMTVWQIRKLMIEKSIGIDCSGFIVHCLGFWLKTVKHMKLQNILIFDKNGLIDRIRRFFRPVENISANVLTSNKNCLPVYDLNTVLPGYLIRSKGAKQGTHHVMLVSKVYREDGKVVKIEYVHSTYNYKDHNGVRFGEIEITDIKKPLEKQKWLEIEEGRNYTLEGYLKDVEDNGIRKLRKVDIDFQIK